MYKKSVVIVVGYVVVLGTFSTPSPCSARSINLNNDKCMTSCMPTSASTLSSMQRSIEKCVSKCFSIPVGKGKWTKSTTTTWHEETPKASRTASHKKRVVRRNKRRTRK